MSIGQLLAANALVKMGKAGQEAINNLVSTYMSGLDNKDSNIRAQAAYDLGKMGPSAKVAIPALILALKDKDSHVRARAADALGNMGPEAKEAISALIAALKDEDSNVRASAAEALGNMGQQAKEAIPALIATLKDEKSYVRYTAAEVLGKMGEEAKEAIPALIAALKYEDSYVSSYYVRFTAAIALGNMGEEAKEAIPQLILTTQNPKECTSVIAVSMEALRQIDPNQANAVSIVEGRQCEYNPPKPVPAPSVASSIISYRKSHPLAICQFSIIKTIIPWKCPNNPVITPSNSPKPSTSPPVKK